MRHSGLLLRRLPSALPLAAALAFGLGPAAAPASEFRPDGDACPVTAGSPHPAEPNHHAGAHKAPCLRCVPALAADHAPVPPPDRAPSGDIHPADISEPGIEVSGPNPPSRR